VDGCLRILGEEFEIMSLDRHAATLAGRSDLALCEPRFPGLT
jgi:hypothetical protein